MTTFLDDETLTLYIEESREHLETIESDLLELEKQGDQFDEDLVNKVFRAAHSIKGGGGFLGLTNIKELAHKIENVLHLIRTSQLSPTSPIVNTLLKSYDRLGEMIDHPADSNDVDISGYLSSLEDVAQGESGAEADQPAQPAKTVLINHPAAGLSFSVSELDISQVQHGGKQLYILDVDLIRNVHKQQKTPFDIITLLQDAGEIIDVQTDLSHCGDLFSDISEPVILMCVLYATIVEPELMGIMFNLNDEQVHPININQLEKQEAGDAAPAVQDTPVTPPADSPETDAGDTGKPAAMAPELAESRAGKPEAAERETKPQAPRKQPATSETLRVNVRILDQLMNRAGELVLARNQLMQAIQSCEQQEISSAGQRVDIVTSELQETIMLTRMQPVGIVFNKFPRVVRGLAMDLGKKIELKLEGTDVELDKTIIEGLGDPLTHLVRNSADHGVETPDIRAQKGKPRVGTVRLRAFYESGQVMIEIADDGKGLDPEKIAAKAVSKGLFSEEDIASLSDKEKFNLIMLPGFSTAEKVTDVSGRGVGMDVVKTNLDKLGGQVELISEVDRGTTIRIKLPLTLAIIPSLLAQSSKEWFALPQSNVSELLRIPASEIRKRVEKIGEADVLNLRGDLIPLLQLNNVLNLAPSYYDYKTGTFKPDRRGSVSDQRLQDDTAPSPDLAPERRNRRESDIIVVVLADGSQKYGLIVDSVSDSVEIVVKPLGRHLSKNKAYAGATIMGDGHVALILDVHGLAELSDLRGVSEGDQGSDSVEEEVETITGATRQTLLIFHNGPEESCAVPLEQVHRVERIMAGDIEIKGGKKIIKYRGGNLTVYALEEVADVEMLEAREKLIVIIFTVAGHEVGLLAVQPLDVVDQELVLDDKTLRQPGIAGSTIIDGNTTLLVDIYELVKILNPGWFESSQPSQISPAAPAIKAEHGDAVLLVEDSQFFRNQVKHFIEEAGYTVIEAEDGQQAWHVMEENPAQISIVVTDLEMPNMDGFELTRLIKNDPRFSHLQVIALTSLAAEEDRRKGEQVGIDDYQIKLDKEKLMASIQARFG